MDPEKSPTQKMDVTSSDCELNDSLNKSLPYSLINSDVMSLAASFNAERVRAVEDYALDFVCNEIQHPSVFSCFRELTGGDMNFVISSIIKLKKTTGTLEQSILYLGLIDHMAMTIDNPLYKEQKKQYQDKKGIPFRVQKVMLHFKNIIGSWGLSDNPILKARYDLVMKYLAALVHRFHVVQFDKPFEIILNSIKKEIARIRSNSEMIKALSVNASAISNIKDSEIEVNQNLDLEEDLVLSNIDLNISLNINDDEDEESTKPLIKLLDLDSSKINFPSSPEYSPSSSSASSTSSVDMTQKSDKKKPKLNSTELQTVMQLTQQESDQTQCETLKSQTKSKSRPKPKKSFLPHLLDGTLDRSRNEVVCDMDPSSKYPASVERQKKEQKKSAKTKKSQVPKSNKAVNSTLNLKKKLSEVSEMSQIGNDESRSKKPRLEANVEKENSKVILKADDLKNKSEVMNPSKEKFQDKELNNKPKLNAFTILMNRSKEISQEKKLKLKKLDSLNNSTIKP